MLEQNRTRENSSAERTQQSPAALGQGPRVVWDMTFARRSMTGTRVYAENLYRTLKATSRLDLQEICAASRNEPGLKANARNVGWLLFAAEREALRQQPALYHAAAYLAPRYLPCPLILNVFDTTYLAFPRDFDWKWNLYARTVIPKGVEKARAIITLSQHARDEIVRAYGVPPARVHIVPPGVGAGFRPITDLSKIAEIRTRFRLGQDYLLYVGGREHRKNLPALISAFAQLRREFPNLQLALVGPKRTDAELEHTISDCKVHDAVRELDYVPTQDLATVYAGARAFVYASLLEGFGIPPVEAMACGVPVVAMPHPPLLEVLGNAAYFSETGTPQSFAQAIARVLGDDALAAELRMRGTERAKRYTWESAARKTLAIYESILTR